VTRGDVTAMLAMERDAITKVMAAKFSLSIAMRNLDVI
jgi:hypothetical protein